jgi:hypothetical protein
METGRRCLVEKPMWLNLTGEFQVSILVHPGSEFSQTVRHKGGRYVVTGTVSAYDWPDCHLVTVAIKEADGDAKPKLATAALISFDDWSGMRLNCQRDFHFRVGIDMSLSYRPEYGHSAWVGTEYAAEEDQPLSSLSSDP